LTLCPYIFSNNILIEVLLAIGKNTRAGGTGQMVECQPKQHEALNSNPSDTNLKKEKKKY
jgi:hypothetical protein